MEMNHESMEDIFQYEGTQYQEGDIITGKVVGKIADGLIVDIGLKSEGIVPISDFVKEEKEFKIGDAIEVILLKKESKSGQIILSYEQARQVRIWEKLEQVNHRQEIVEGVVTKKLKGGVNVELFGTEVFMPASHIGLTYIKDLDTLIGQTVKVRIITFDQNKPNVVVSQRVVMEEELKHKKEQLWNEIKVGDTCKGIIKNITDFGAFVDLGGSEGLLHVHDLSWGKTKKVSDILKIGEEIEVKILQLDKINEKISLGLKQLTPDPWSSVKIKYPVDAVVDGKVSTLADFGAFVELEEGVEGLIHVSEMSWVEYVKHPSKILKAGDMVQAKVLAIDEEKRRISLGLRQVQPNPWLEAGKKYKPGAKVTGIVSHIAPFGAFVKLADGIEGLIHVSDLSWQERISHPKQILKIDDKIVAVVLKVDETEQKISLGFKQLQENPYTAYQAGDILDVEVAEVVPHGVVVAIHNQLKGFIHVSQLSAGEYVEDPAKIVKPGQKLTAKVIKVDTTEGKINLSVKEYSKAIRKKTIAQYSAQQEQKVTLGDVMGENLAKFLKKE